MAAALTRTLQRRLSTRRSHLLLGIAISSAAVGCNIDRAPEGLKRTPDGPGATIRYDLGHDPLPDIPLPIDTATWPDPSSRTGLRINASLIAPTAIEEKAREKFSQLEGWGTFSPITVSFDRTTENNDPARAAIDLNNVRARHLGDDYNFANDAVYVINLETGVPAVLDFGAGNFDYTLRELDRYWPNDTRGSERNLLFETIDETRGGQVTLESFTAADDTDFDGTLDVPNLNNPRACPDPDPVCDNQREPDDVYNSPECLETRRSRDRCIADELATYYERETDTLIMRPLLPLKEQTRYAVVVTDRLVDDAGFPVRSPFDFVYHAAQESVARRVRDVLAEGSESYFGDIAGTGLDHVAFTWGFTTQPTVDDLRRLRDGLYGQGPFAKLAVEYPPRLEVRRAVGLTTDYENEDPNWEASSAGQDAACGDKADNLYIVKQEDIAESLRDIITQGFGSAEAPDLELLLRVVENIDYLMIANFETPYFLEGGPDSTDPNASFDINYLTGDAEKTTDTVQVWVVVPKETEQFKQPFNVNLYGHGYTGNLLEQIFYAGNMAQHGLATVGINAMGHGLTLSDLEQDVLQGILSGSCLAPFAAALTEGRARDLDNDGTEDSGADFWSSYLFHTRDGVRQSVLDHIQLVRIMRSFGTDVGRAVCATEATNWQAAQSGPCDLTGDGTPELYGDFDGNGVIDFGGPNVNYATWGESLGGILSAIHGAIDAYIDAASPGSGGGGLTDIGVRSFQGGVVEAVLLRLWGPLLVTIPAEERESCSSGSNDKCTLCGDGQFSLRWVVPDLNDDGEVEIACVERSDIASSTVFVYNEDNEELRCARLDDTARMRVGIPASIGDRVRLDFYDGVDQVVDYDSCKPLLAEGTLPRFSVDRWGPGLFAEGTENAVGTDACSASSCNVFQGTFVEEGARLTAIAEGFGQIRQTPSLRRFIGLAQTALEPGDPISFASLYAIDELKDPFGEPLPPRAVLTLNTIGDMNVPLNAGIAFARATGALPFLRPDQAPLYPEYAAYVTPPNLFQALGKTPNQDLIDNHVIEGIRTLARHPADPACATSANSKPLDATFLDADDNANACFPTGCNDPDNPTDCFPGSECDQQSGQCVPRLLGERTCDEALYDADDLDEGLALFFEQAAPVPHRLARYSRALDGEGINDVWTPRLYGQPFGDDFAWQPDETRPLTALLNAYVVPQGVHTFVNGNPCDSFDAGTYLSNLVARFFQTGGTDLYYLSHPATHRCLGAGAETCDYLVPAP